LLLSDKKLIKNKRYIKGKFWWVLRSSINTGGIRLNVAQSLTSTLDNVEPYIKILLLEDQPKKVSLFKELLSTELDIELIHLYDPSKLFSEILRINPTVVLIHLAIPGIDVPELIRKIKGAPLTYNIPIIVFCEENDPALRLEAFYAGAIDYISHTPEKVELVSKLRYHALQYLRQSQAIEELKQLRQKQAKLKRITLALKELSYLDPLTNIYNRRRFDEVFRLEWRRQCRSGHNLSLIMLDIDLFKSYNDIYGHQAGDRCIVNVAKAIKRSTKRAGDLVARYGGEEFVVLLPDTTLTGAFIVAERIRNKVKSLNIEHRGNKKGIVTISGGVATIIPKRYIEPEELIFIADKALYCAKQNGRDQIYKVNPHKDLTRSKR